MAKIIQQFTVTDEEYNSLEQEARKMGYSSVEELAKAKTLDPLPSLATYAEYREKMKNIIQDLEPGEFALRDIIKIPPALLGRYLYEDVRDGKIADVSHIGRDESSERYRKN